MFYDYIASRTESTEYDKKAAQHIDILTYNRIGEFTALSPYQQHTVTRVHEQLAWFEEENADMLESYLSQYSINGVGMSFGDGSWALKMISGVAIPGALYALLRTTGLCDLTI